MKLLLTDIDGVVLDWVKAFETYLDKYYPGNKLADPKEFDLNLRYTDLQPMSESMGKDKNYMRDIVKNFNNTAWIGFLEPFRDAKEILPKIKADGWTIIGCTSMGTDSYATALRRINLENHFPDVFNKVDILPFAEHKGNWLKQYRDSGAYWIEDKWINAIAGADIGLNTLIMKHDYNAFMKDNRLKHVDTWQQIYSIITK
jgi:hypothetical protein